jgi:hypothetical protein
MIEMFEILPGWGLVIVDLILRWAWLIGIVTLLIFGGSLVVTVGLIITLPDDYWRRTSRTAGRKGHPLQSLVRNIAAVCLLTAGVIMLLMPGQGILTLLAGFFISDFPCRRRVIDALLKSSRIQGSLNHLRKRFGKDPFLFDP